MADSNKLDNDVQKLKKERYNWKMGIGYKSLNQTEFMEEMKIKFEYLHSSSKTLFKNIIDDELDESRYKDMIQLLKQVNNNNVSIEKASEEFGKTCFDKYVKPLIEKEKK